MRTSGVLNVSERRDRKMMDMLEKMRIVKKTDADDSTGYLEIEPEYEPVPAPQAESPQDRLASFFATQPAPAAPASAPLEPQVGSVWDDEPVKGLDTNRFTEVRELYALLGMQTAGPTTVYLLEEYMKTLPDSLPAESRRAIIIKLVAAAGFDFDKLLGDGVDRVTKLTEHASAFAARTDEVMMSAARKMHTQ